MDTTDNQDYQSDEELRRRAEKLLSGQVIQTDDLDDTSLQELLHELRVHQIELQMQNQELQETRNALEETAEQYQDLYDSAPAGYLTLDADQIIRKVNITAINMLGGARPSILGQPFFRYVHQEDQNDHYLRFRDLLRHETPETWTVRLQRRQHPHVFVQLECTPVAVNGSQEFRVIMVDVSERENARVELFRRQRQLQGFLRASPDFIYAYHVTEERLIFHNHTEFLGYPAAEFESIAFLENLVSLEDRQALTRFRQQLRESDDREQVSCEIEYDLQTAGGEVATVRQRGVILQRDMFTQQPEEILYFLTDITRQKQAIQQEIELEIEHQRVEVLQKFIADASHDLRTPMGTILNALYIVEHTDNPERIPAEVQHLKNHVNYLKRIVEDMLSMAQLDETPAMNITSLFLNGLIEDMVQDYQAMLDEHRQQVQLKFFDEMSTIQVDRLYIKRALLNILSNAIQHTPPGTIITIRTGENDTQQFITIHDNGPGIPAEHLPYIFNRFYRSDKARAQNTREQGSGLGLPIARRIIEMHGGEISVKSKPGKGTSFHIVLPHRNATPESD